MAVFFGELYSERTHLYNKSLLKFGSLDYIYFNGHASYLHTRKSM